MTAPLPYEFVGPPMAGQVRESVGLSSMLGSAGLPSLTGGGSAASTNPYTVFGDVNINTGNILLYVILFGAAGYFVWKKIVK